MPDNPFVSIIIPVYNSPGDIQECLESVLRQSYPKDRYEIIVVDNGSTDNTRNKVEEYPVRMFVEDEIQGSYAARNKGIRNSEGEFVALIDADCIAQEDWLEEGVKQLQGADLVGGKVTFTYSDSPSAAEIFDSVTNLDLKKKIERGVAATANLFVRKTVFDDIGLFPSGLKSGGDVQWTGTATDHGYELTHAPNAEVYHPARKFRPLMKKQYRVGRGQIQVWQNEGRNRLQILRALIRGFLPLLPSTIAQRLRENEIECSFLELASVWVISWCFIVTMNVGRISKLFL